MALRAGLLAYDVADNRRRARLFRLLGEYGLPVQESVFALELPSSQWRVLRAALRQVIDTGADDVRVWHLCDGCVGRAEVWSGAPGPRIRPVEVL